MLQQSWGPLAAESALFDFANTTYYEPQMGGGLKLQLLAFEQPMEPAALVQRKLAANELEALYAASGEFEEQRPLNIDPGYLTLAKFVLATTKDASHRLYLGEGIFAEVTLYYAHGKWQAWPWTYPNYREQRYHEFLSRCRKRLAQLCKEDQQSPER